MKSNLQKFFSNHQVKLFHALIAGILLAKSFAPFDGWMLFYLFIWVIPLGFLFNYLAGGE